MLVTMVNREVVLQTIKKMKESGIDNSVIKATLKDIGLNDEESKQYMKEAAGEKAEAKKEADIVQDQIAEKTAEKTAEKIKEELVAENEERELRDTTQRVVLEEQKSKMEDVEKGVGKLHQKIESLATPANKELSGNIAVLEQRINGIDKKISDLKAINTATKDLMEKVLEANRKILTKL